MDYISKAELQMPKQLSINSNLKQTTDSLNSPLRSTEPTSLATSTSTPKKNFLMFKSYTNQTPSKKISGAITSREPREVKFFANEKHMKQISVIPNFQKLAMENATSNPKDVNVITSLNSKISQDKNLFIQNEALNASSLTSAQQKSKEILNDIPGGQRNNTKLPSYLIPTYAALQLKKQKLEFEEKQRFSFGKGKGKKHEYVASNKKLAEENSVFDKSDNQFRIPSYNSILGNDDVVRKTSKSKDITHDSQSPKITSQKLSKNTISLEKIPSLHKNIMEQSKKLPRLKESQSQVQVLHTTEKNVPQTTNFEGRNVLVTKENHEIQAPLSNEPTDVPELLKTKSPLQAFPEFMPDRNRATHEFLKLHPAERLNIETSFRLRPSLFKSQSVTDSPAQQRNSSFPEINRILQERLDKAEKIVPKKEMFSNIKALWNSGLTRSLSQEEKQNLMFKVDDVTFFNMNPGTKFADILHTDNEIINQNMIKTFSPQDLNLKNKALIAKFHSQNQVIQPNYMKESGTMCFTEFWSDKQRSSFYATVKKRIKQIKVHNTEEDQWESVYRPEKIKSQQNAKQKILESTGGNSFGARHTLSPKPQFKLFGKHSPKADNAPLSERLYSKKKISSLESSPQLTRHASLSRFADQRSLIVKERATDSNSQNRISTQETGFSEEEESLPNIKKEFQTLQPFKFKQSTFGRMNNKSEVGLPVIDSKLESTGLEPQIQETRESQVENQNSILILKFASEEYIRSRGNSIDLANQKTVTEKPRDSDQESPDIKLSYVRSSKRHQSDKSPSIFGRKESIGFTGGTLKDDYGIALSLYNTLYKRFTTTEN